MSAFFVIAPPRPARSKRAREMKTAHRKRIIEAIPRFVSGRSADFLSDFFLPDAIRCFV